MNSPEALPDTTICTDTGSTTLRVVAWRLLPLLIRETWPFMRYMLKRRGVFTTLFERAPAGAEALDDGDQAEIDILLEAIKGDITAYPFLLR